MSGAEFLVEFFAEEALTKLGSTAIDEFVRVWGLKKDLEKLRERARSIQSLLQQVVKKQATDARVNPWLEKLQDQVYDADDVLDEFSYEVLRRKIEIGDQLKRKICCYLLCGYNPVSFRRQIANKVKKINESLADIENQAIYDFHLRNAVGAYRGGAAIKPDQMGTHSMLDESKPPVGRKEELEKINNFLETKSSLHGLKFVCILGFGGLGKTTLAKMVSDKARKNNLFDVIVWIDVSITSNATKILGDILQKLDPSSAVSNNIDIILENLRNKLEEKSFLLILDNVWSREDTDWLNLKENLSLISKRDGNCVIMTTRIMELKNVMGTSCQCLVKLQDLSDDECWSIIKGKVFGKGEELPEDEDLRGIGVDIAKKCRGVPLVANVVGGMLHARKDTSYWVSLRESNVWQDMKENNILPVLRLSFDHLPSPLRQCFAYCSLFPKNFIFRKKQLIQLWMAEGFLHEASENATASESSMEDIGAKYFDQLWANSFFQNVKVDEWGGIIRCNMHDIIHDLAMSVSAKHKQDGSSNHTCKTHDRRRMSFFVDDEGHPSVENYAREELRKLRSLHSNRAVFLTWSDLESLRTLNLCGANYEELPTAIGELKHLRYFDISDNHSIQELPDSITKLYNLQTLFIKCSRLKQLPSNIGILVNLRYIRFRYYNLMPFKVGSLINLRQLPLFVVKQEEGYGIQELKHLNELRGKLKIRDLQHVRNVNEALAANLKGKRLTKLNLIWEDVEDGNDERESLRYSNHKEVLEGLVPPGSTVSLRIQGYMGKVFPEWMSRNGGSESSLNQLAKLQLYCGNFEIMPTLGHLPSLKILEIGWTKNVRRIGSEFYGESKGNVKKFPMLEQLKLFSMDSLEEWEAPDDINHAIPSLKVLIIRYCRRLKSIPCCHLFSLKSLEIKLCPKLSSLSIVSMSLEDLIVHGCVELDAISSSQELISLKHMSIGACSLLTSIPDRGLLSLEKLIISKCEKLEFYSSRQDHASLNVWSSPKLTALPQGLKFLKNLSICYLSDLSADAFCGLSSLELCEIEGIENLELMPSVEDLSSLKSLGIKHCPNLISLPKGLHLLKCLQKLEISTCDKISALSEIKSCTSLNNLSVTCCTGLISIETDIISSLTQLESLCLGPFSDELLEFPDFDGSQGAINNPSLKVLILYGNHKMKSLPYLGNLTGVEKLDICNFRISALPVWFSKLSKLTTLSIEGSTLLADEFMEDRRAVWPNISHIAHIIMDDEVIQDLIPRRTLGIN